MPAPSQGEHTAPWEGCHPVGLLARERLRPRTEWNTVLAGGERWIPSLLHCHPAAAAGQPTHASPQPPPPGTGQSLLQRVGVRVIQAKGLAQGQGARQTWIKVGVSIHMHVCIRTWVCTSACVDV